MANAQQPTCRTRHMDIKTFALQNWIKKNLILMKHINTADNCADVLTKLRGRKLHYCHNDYILGKIIPKYAVYSLQPHIKV